MPTALAIALAALTVAACTGQPSEPSPTAARPVAASSARATAPPSQVPSDTPTPAHTSGADQDVSTPPGRPAALDGPATEENAKAVGRYYLSLFPYAVATGDLSQWDALSGEGCRYCDHLRAIVTDIHDAGNHGTGGAYELGFTSGLKDEDGHFIVGIEYVETPSRTVAADGTLVEDFPDRYTMKAVLELSWSGSSWTIEHGKATEFGDGE